MMAQQVPLNKETYARLRKAYDHSKRVHGRQYHNYTFQTYVTQLMIGALAFEEALHGKSEANG